MKNDRVVIRLPAAEKELWQKVAKEHGLDLTELVTRSVRGSIAALTKREPLELPGTKL